jgi:hypothetical protein
MSTICKHWLAVVSAMLLFYVVSFMILSSLGQYVPSSWGAGWVKSYIWAPRGFVSGPTGRDQNRLVQNCYLPLWWIDTRLVHKSDHARDGKYPINTLLDSQLQIGEKIFEKNQMVQRTGASRSAQNTNQPSSAAGSPR